MTSAFRLWADMVKLSHSIFALPFAVIAAVLAGRHLTDRSWPYLGQMVLIVVCMVTARSVAMTFNRIVDAQIDARNPRTASRPLPSGKLSFGAAWVMLGLSVITFGIACLGFYLLYKNTWPILLAGPVLIYICGYSVTKRFTRWSHFYLGSAIALAPVATWLAVEPTSMGLSAMVLLVTVALWIAGFDIIYSCQDIDADRQEKLHSLPSRLGPSKALWIARLSHIGTVGGLLMLGTMEQLGVVYAGAVVIVSILLVVENALVRPSDYSKVNLAFFTINGVVSILLALAVGLDLLWRMPPVFSLR